MMTASVRVKDFQPSINGFHFSNSWPSEPDISIPFLGRSIKIGDASKGLCGGMAYAVRDYFEDSTPIPETGTNPELHSPLYNFIVRRLFDSFDIPAGVAEYMEWQLPTRNQFHDTAKGEWPKIKEGLDAGQLVTLGLIRTRSFSPAALGKNHQVLAYGYDLDDAEGVTLQLYDPNHAGNDKVTLAFSAAHPATQEGLAYDKGAGAVPKTSGEFTYGAFVATYRHVSPGQLSATVA